MMIDDGMGWAIFGSMFFFIFILLGILADRQRQKGKLAKQEMLQKERLMAMEKGLPLPEWDAAMLDDDGKIVSSSEAHQRRKEWFQMVTLCVGLVLSFSGIGMLLAFHYDSDFHDISAVGAIPLMAGVGLLLFYLLTRQSKA